MLPSKEGCGWRSYTASSWQKAGCADTGLEQSAVWSTANLLDVTSSTPQTESRVFKSQTILLTGRSQIKYDRQPNWKDSLHWTPSKQLRDGMANYTLARSLGGTRGHSRQPFSPAQAQTTTGCRQHRISSTTLLPLPLLVSQHRTSEVDTTIPGLINSTCIHRVNRLQAMVFSIETKKARDQGQPQPPPPPPIPANKCASKLGKGWP